jgi:hypothetical protein
MNNLLIRAKEEYLRLLRLSPNTWDRHFGQAYMAFLRDFIAEVEGREAEEVQVEYEHLSLEA